GREVAKKGLGAGTQAGKEHLVAKQGVACRSPAGPAIQSQPLAISTSPISCPELECVFQFGRTTANHHSAWNCVSTSYRKRSTMSRLKNKAPRPVPEVLVRFQA